MTGPYVIGCDVGSQGTNTALYSADGKLVASAYQAYDVLFPHPGWAEQDPREWIKALHSTIRRVLEQVEPSAVKAISFGSQLDGMVVCHGSPRSDIESFAPDPQPEEERMLGGEAQRTILFGHSHRQFERAGPNGTYLVNPGSVGAPLDGDPRAAWALYDDGELRLRRTVYDVERAAARMRSYGEWAEPIVRRIEHGSD